MRLYEHTTPALQNDPESIPADLAHHFLLGLTTKPGFGICFKDRGWYPRTTRTEEEQGSNKGGKIYNKILLNILKMLKVNEDPRQHELALRVLESCPELTAP